MEPTLPMAVEAGELPIGAARKHTCPSETLRCHFREDGRPRARQRDKGITNQLKLLCKTDQSRAI